MSVHQAAGVIVQYLAQRGKVRAMLEDQVNDGLRGTDYDPQSTPAPQRPEGWDPNDPQNWPPPSYGDPAGETATHGDRARRDLAELAKAEAAIEAQAKVLDRVLGRTVFAKDLDPTQRRKLGRVTPQDPWCVVCSNEPACTAAPTTVAGNLDQATWLGRSCYDRVRATGLLPTKADLGYFRKHGRWPRPRDTAA